MSYVDAGYAIALGALGLYAVGLVLRRRRLERAAALLDAPRDDGFPGGATGEVFGREGPPPADGGR